MIAHPDVGERAVSPVVALVLVLTIMMLLTTVIGGVALGLDIDGVGTPQVQLEAQFDYELEDGSGGVEIRHDGGEPLPADRITFVVDGNATDMTSAYWTDDGDPDGRIKSEEKFSAGGSLYIHTESSEEVLVVWNDPHNDNTAVLERFVA